MLEWRTMRATLRLPRRATYADYLAAEQNSQSRHEFLEGVIVAHNAVAGQRRRRRGRQASRLSIVVSLQAYVLAAQDARCVKVYRRSDRGDWRSEPDVYRDGQSFELPMLDRSIAVAEIYDGILDADGRSRL